MYGLVNKAVKDLVLNKFGKDSWDKIRKEAKLQISDFEGMKTYDDSITYDLVGAASKILNLPAEAILKAFGEYWVLFTAQEGYGDLMDLFGHDLKTCIKNLNSMHGRMGAMMPDLKPPRFVVTCPSDDLIEIEYHSTRLGLAPMVSGLLEGLIKKFNAVATVAQIPKRAGENFDRFTITIKG